MLNRMDRRGFLRGAALATAGLAAGTMPLSASPISKGRLTGRGEVFPRSPDEALDRLVEGNGRFASGQAAGMNRTLDHVRSLAGGQAPFAAVLTCADSRVPPELLFDQGFGDIFTVRVAGNVAGTEEVASLEYSVGVLGSQVLMVLGHTSCGAVDAAMKGGPVPGQISALYSHITPAIQTSPDLSSAVEANVRHQARVIRTSSPVMREGEVAGTLKVVGAVYDLASGEVRIVEEG